jgi:hypothetical protein
VVRGDAHGVVRERDVLLEQVDARFAKAMNETVRSVATTSSPARELIAFALALVAAVVAWGVSGFGSARRRSCCTGGARSRDRTPLSMGGAAVVR